MMTKKMNTIRPMLRLGLYLLLAALICWAMVGFDLHIFQTSPITDPLLNID